VDERFPKYLRWLVHKLDFIGLPNLGMLICGLAVLGFVGQHMLGAPLHQFTFHPELIRQGQWWRLFAFPVSEGLANPIWLLFYVMYIYFVMNALEGQWGPGPLTVFTMMAYACTMAGSVVTNQATNIWYHVLENVSLAFGTLFPNVELLLFFVLPVKAKWLAMLAGAVLTFQFLTNDSSGKIFLLLALSPYLLWFGPYLISTVRSKYKMAKHKKRFDNSDWK